MNEKDTVARFVSSFFVRLFMLSTFHVLPAGEVAGRREGVAGDTLAVATIVTLVNLTSAAGVLRQTAAQL